MPRLVLALLLGLVALPAWAEGETVRLRLLGTTDLHTHLVDYDYYKDAPDNSLGLARTASLIKAARSEARNVLLFDSGDTLQGNPLGDWVAREAGLKPGDTHPMFAAMNLLRYDAATLGNHEFNYGLDFLKTALAGAKFPYVTANVVVAGTDRPLIEPRTLLDRDLIDEAGGTQHLRIGVIGFVPPQIMLWDKANLDGRVESRDIVETAEREVPKLRQSGADLVVALVHSGFAPPPRKGRDENAAAYLAEVPGIDAVMAGHAHRVFPGPDYAMLPGADFKAGKIKGVPVTMAGFWGSHLAVIDLVLRREGTRWQVVESTVAARPIRVREGTAWVVKAEPDPEILALAKPAHEATLAYVRRPVGKTASRIHSYFALVQDDPSVQLVNDAQRWFVARALKGTAQEGLPLLSAAAPFKAGGRGGAQYYTDIPAGDLAIRNVADLYLYPNTLRAVVVTGAAVREWLEMSAGMFNAIEPGKTGPQPILSDRFPSYNFDVIDGVTYRIDVTKPARYDAGGKVIAPDSHRIVDLAFQGKPIVDDQRFVVATNNYRAGGGGNFPGLDGSNIILEAQDTNQQLIVEYLKDRGTIDPSADGNWGFAPVAAPVEAVFESAPAAQDLAAAGGRIRYLGPGEGGFARYRLDLQ
jgi:2',3'-cyclic-nucleotide 2'-phosphodiesterase/3'-nucleotidase